MPGKIDFDDEANPVSAKQLAVIGLTLGVLGFGIYYLFFREPISAFEPRTVPAQGTVTLKGQTRAGIRVTYHPQFDVGSKKFTPNGTTDSAGKYVISTARPHDGAPAGEYIVTFDFPYVTNGPVEEEVDLFKGKYSDPTKSQWKVTVAPNSDASFQLD